MATTLPLVGYEGGSAATGLTLDPTMHASAAQNDDLFIHIMFAATGVAFDATGDWTAVETVNGPTYTSVVLHCVQGATPNLVLDWTAAGNQVYTYQTVALDPLDTGGQIEASASLETLGSAVLPRLTGLPDPETIHMLCFAGSINVNSATTVAARPDVGFLNTGALENPEVAGNPVLWGGDFPGPLGDSDVTLNSAVYFDPPPSHSVGHSLALVL